MVHKKHASFWAYSILLFVLWLFVFPLTVRERIRDTFFSAQVVIFNLLPNLSNLQQEIALRTYPKDWWIKRTQELLRENAYLKLQLQEHKDVHDFANRILKLNQIQLGEDFRGICARVIFRAYETWNQTLVIDKGTQDGVSLGQGVICTGGIVGRISHVKNHLAFVELATSPQFRMFVHLEKDTQPHLLKGVANVRGSFKGKAHLLDIVSDNPGDYPCRIETSSLGHQFPDHIYVGQLKKLKKKHGQSYGVVTLGNYFHDLREVTVLIPNTLL